MNTDQQLEIKLSDKCPEYAKNMNHKQRYLLIKLMEQYCKRFDWSIQGSFYPYVEIQVKDKYMQDMIKIFNEGFGKAENSNVFMNRVGKDKKGYDCRTKFNKYEWSLDKEKAEKFFSIFDENIIQPKVEKVWVHLKMQKSIFRSLTDEEINILYHTDDEQLSEKIFEKIEEGMTGGMEGLVCAWRRIQVLFGTSLRNKRKIDCMRLEYFENVNPISKTGVLKLNFTYQTYLNGVPLGIFPTDNTDNTDKTGKTETKKRKNCEKTNQVSANLLEWIDPSQPEQKTQKELWEVISKTPGHDLTDFYDF